VDHTVVPVLAPRFRALARHRLAVLALLGLALVVAGCAAEYPQNAMESRSDFTAEINGLFWTIIYWSIPVFIIVEVGLVFVLWRYRRRPGAPMPAQVHGNTTIEILWTLAPALILATIAVPTVQTIFRTQAEMDPRALQVRVVAHQWWFEFHYPKENIHTASDLWIPAGRKIDLQLESADVIHNFWPPKLAGKRYNIPGHTNRLTFTTNEPGLYWGRCTEYCGTSHANMGFRVIVASDDDFRKWVGEFQKPRGPQSVDPLVQQGQQTFLTSACIGCHAIAGTPAQARVGPDLTYFGRRHTIAGALMDNTPENLALWLKNPPAVKPGSLMPNLNLSDEQVRALVAYLESLR
jgi:cytochrome c oxidase subunit 2